MLMPFSTVLSKVSGLLEVGTLLKRCGEVMTSKFRIDLLKFLPKHSILTNLLVYQNFLINSLDQDFQVDAK